MVSWQNSKSLQGIIYMLLCCFCYGLTTTFSKLLLHKLDPYQVTFYRHLFSALILLPYILKVYTLPQIILGTFSKINTVRAIISVLGIICWGFALKHMPTTNVIAISYLTPVFTSILAVLFLKERLTIPIILALIMGLVGVYIISNFNLHKLNLGVIFVLITCFLWACSSLFVKRLTKSYCSFMIVFAVTLIGTFFSLPFLLANPQLPDTYQLLIIIAIAASATAAQVLAAKSFAVASLTVVMPFDFFRLIFTHILAIIILNEQLTYETFVGAIIIFSAGMLVLNKEVKVLSLLNLRKVGSR